MTEQLGLDLEPAQPRRRREAALESFHVRAHVTVTEALDGERRAGKQDADILAFFQKFPGRWTPSDVHRDFPKMLLTSVRRSLTNLTTRGLLTHHPTDRRPGPFGAKESTWSLA